jgi:hypothetical protein
MGFTIPFTNVYLNDQYTLLLQALAITLAAVGIGWWIKRKFTSRQ